MIVYLQHCCIILSFSFGKFHFSGNQTGIAVRTDQLQHIPLVLPWFQSRIWHIYLSCDWKVFYMLFCVSFILISTGEVSFRNAYIKSRCHDTGCMWFFREGSIIIHFFSIDMLFRFCTFQKIMFQRKEIWGLTVSCTVLGT